MAVDQIGGASYTSQIESMKINTDTQKVNSVPKQAEQEIKSVQDKVEISQTKNTQQLESGERIKESAAAQDMKDKVRAQMEAQPYQAMYAQGNNMTASRVANLL